MEASIENIKSAIVECQKGFEQDKLSKENCVNYKNKLIEKIGGDILKLRTLLDFENRMHGLIEGDVNALEFGNEPKPYSDSILLYMGSNGQLKFKLTQQDEVILDSLYAAAKAVYEYGNAYCRMSRNSTSFIEDNFGDDARSITSKIYISPAMSDYLYGIQQTWHWHGH